MVYGSTEKITSLTPAQKDVLEFILKRYRQTGIAPSYREIQEEFQYKAVGTVQDHVEALRKKGFLERPDKSRKARGLLPVGKKVPEGTKRLPIYGEIAAGLTRETPQLEIGQLAILESVAKDPCFGLRVVGDSMSGVGIFEGDYLIVEKRQNVKSGDIVVALVQGETTVKRYRKNAEGIFLVPENPKYKPLKIQSDSFEIQGVVVGLQRKF